MPLLIIPAILAVVAIADILSGDTLHARFLPPAAWIAIVALVPIVGAVLWFTVGVERTFPELAGPDETRPVHQVVHGR